MWRRTNKLQAARATTALTLAVAWCATGAAFAGKSAGLQGTALDQLKTAGKGASLTVLPVGLAGRPSTQVGEVLGMMLERGGMTQLELGVIEFRAPENADLGQLAKSVGEFVRANPTNTEYALFAEFLGVPGKSVSEVRGVIVNKQGEPVWQDRQTSADADFKRIKPGEPMTCCLLLVERLRPVLGLADPNRADAPEGRLAQRWARKTGLPTDDEQKAISDRQKALKKAAATSTMKVYPARTGAPNVEGTAAHLTKLINDAGLTKAVAASEGLKLDIKGNMNEQQVLWDMARAFSAHVQADPPESDYALLADYLLGKDAVGGVHLAVCNRKGELVVVDFQNNHHEDFNAVKPKTVEDCDRLAVRRLEKYMK